MPVALHFSLELAPGCLLRKAQAADHSAMSMVCFATGNAGGPIEDEEPGEDRSLLGSIFAIPYQVYEPDFAFVLQDELGVCGYLLAAPNAAAFHRRLAREWFPPLQRQVQPPAADRGTWRGRDWARHLLHHPFALQAESLLPFPAEAHIDLLPRLQGRGVGRKAMRFMLDRLAGAGVPGLHLHVHPGNRRAQGFYHSLGFTPLQDSALPDDTLFMVKAL